MNENQYFVKEGNLTTEGFGIELFEPVTINEFLDFITDKVSGYNVPVHFNLANNVQNGYNMNGL